MRRSNKDMAVKYVSMAGCLVINMAKEDYKNNPMYLADQIQKGETATTDALRLVTGRTDEKRK
jgi:hypothetical protein